MATIALNENTGFRYDLSKDVFTILGEHVNRTVPNVLALFHFKKVSRKETVFNQSNGRKFKNILFAQANSLTEQRDYFRIF